MGDELVSDPSPVKRGGKSDDRFAPGFFKKFFKEQFPFYLSIGMSPDQYWDGDVTLTQDYYHAYDLKRHRTNEELWLQGFYIYSALLDVAPVFRSLSKHAEAHKYLDKPLPLSDRDMKKQQEDDEKQRFVRLKQRMMDLANKQRGEVMRNGSG